MEPPENEFLKKRQSREWTDTMEDDDFISEEGEDLGVEGDEEDPGFPSLSQYPDEVVQRVMQLLSVGLQSRIENCDNINHKNN